MLQDPARRGGANPGCFGQVFDCQWNAVQRAFPFSTTNFRLCAPRFFQGRFCCDRDECDIPRIEFLDAGQAEFRQLNGRDLPRLYGLTGLTQIEKSQLVTGSNR